ncbi:MAG: hypothetical protein Q7S34_00905 [bacterium]|nr:hypothetical protein [bacterium]
MKKALLTLTVSFLFPLFTSCTVLQQNLQQKSEKISVWKKFEDEKTRTNDGVMLYNLNSETKALCAIMVFSNEKMAIVLDITRSTNDHYRFGGIIDAITEEDSSNNKKTVPRLRHTPVEIEMKPHGLWIQTTDRTTKLFEQYCPTPLLLQLPFEFQKLFRGFFGVGGGVEI